jgi:hypothetical protein
MPVTDRVRTRVVGCVHMGRAAQRACRALSAGDGLICMREPHNPHDANAVRLLSVTGAAVGYVQAKVAGTVARWMDEGRMVAARVTRATRVMPVREPHFLALQLSYPTAVIWAEDPPAEHFEDEDAIEMEKQRILERTT